MVPNRRRLDGRTLGAYLLCLILAVWVGGSVMIDFVVVPGLFGHESLDRNVAVDLGAWVFRRWNYTECLFGVGAFLFAFLVGRRGWGTRRRHVWATGLAAGMMVLAVLFLMVLTPTITAKVASLRQAGVDFADLRQQPPGREGLHTVHTLYAGLDVAKILAGLLLFWLLVSRRRMG